MADGVNAFTVYSSLELQINEFIQQLNRASQILDSTLQNMSGAVSSLNMPPVEVNTEADTSGVQDVESAVSGIDAPPVNILTEADTSAVWDIENAVSDVIVSPVVVGTEPNLGAVNEIESAVSDINVSPVVVQTESNISGISEIENAMSGMNIPTITIPTETEPLEPVTVPPPDDRTFIQKIKDSFNNLKNAVNSIPSNIVGKFKEMGTNIVNAFRSFPSNVSAKFSEMKTAAVDKIKSIPSSIAGVITSIPSKISSGLKTIGTNISNAFKSGVESAKNALKELPAKAAEILKETGEKLKSIAETVAKSAAVAIGAVSAGVTAGLKKSVDAGMDFDSAMSQVAATMGKTTDEITELRDFAKEMGRTTAFSATQSAEALNYMALAGYDAETSMSMLPNVLNLAAAGGMELALASDMITDTQSALGLSLDETTQLVDKMAKASSKSNTSVAQLGDAMLTVGGTAKKLRGGTTELAAVLGILADNGIKGSEGGTALRNIMNSLISPTDDAAAMLESMGTSLYDSEGNMQSLNDVFIDLRNGMSGLATQAEKDQVLTTIFNDRDQKSAEALITNVGDRFNELSTEIDNCSNAADAMAKTQLDNLAGDVTLFQSALEGAKIAVSDQLTPALSDFVKTGTEGISEIASVLDNSANFDEALDKLFPAIQPYIDKLIGQVLSAIPKVINVAVKLVDILGKAIVKNISKLANSAVELLKGFAENIAKNSPTAIKGFSDMMKSVSKWLKTNGKTLISAGMEMIKSIAKGISENLSTIIKSITEIITFIAAEIRKNTNDLLDSGLNIIVALGKGIFENLPELVGAALDIVTSLGGYLIDKIPVLVEKAPEIVESLANALGDCGEKMVTAADELITKFASAVGLSEQWETIKTSVSNAVSDISSAFSDIKENLEPVKEKFDEFKDAVFGTEDKAGLLKTAIDKLCDAISATIEFVGKVISGLIGFVVWINKSIKRSEKFKDAVESINAAVKIMLGGAVIKGLISQLPVLLGHIVAQTAALAANAAAWIAAAAPILAVGAVLALIIYDIKQVIKNFDELKEFFPLLWKDIKNGLTEFGDAAGGEIYDFIQEKKAAIKQFFADIGDNIGGWIYDRVQEIKDFFGNISDGAKIFIENVKENWSIGINSIKKFFTGLRDHINTIFGAIGRFISGLIENWKSGVSSIKGGIDEAKEKISELPEKFGELVTGAFNWGKDLIENFMQGAKEKIDEWNSFWEGVGFTIYDLLHHSKPEKGPLKDDDKWGGDLMDNLINGVKSRTGELKNTVESIAANISNTFSKPITADTDVTAKFSNLEIPDIMTVFSQNVRNGKDNIISEFKEIAGDIREIFSKPITVDTDVTANGHFSRLKVPDISSVTENIHTVRYTPPESSVQNNSPVVVENLNLTIEGTNFNSEYEMEKFIDTIADRLQARNITKLRGVGGAFY